MNLEEKIEQTERGIAYWENQFAGTNSQAEYNAVAVEVGGRELYLEHLLEIKRRVEPPLTFR